MSSAIIGFLIGIIAGVGMGIAITIVALEGTK